MEGEQRRPVVAGFFAAIGDFGIFSGQVIRRVFSRRYTRWELLDQMHRVGVESLFVVILCAFFIGLVMVLQSAYLLSRYGAKAQVASLMSDSFVREIGPVFTAIMCAGRIGTGITAELASMKVTEQLDAYRVFGSDPIGKLATPRFLAVAILLPALTAIADLVGIFSGFLMGISQLQLSGDVYLQYSITALDELDVFSSVVKGAIFGAVIGLIATYKGFGARRATEAVGVATTETMVLCVLGVLLADVVLAKLFLWIGE